MDHTKHIILPLIALFGLCAGPAHASLGGELKKASKAVKHGVTKAAKDTAGAAKSAAKEVEHGTEKEAHGAETVGKTAGRLSEVTIRILGTEAQRTGDVTLKEAEAGVKYTADQIQHLLNEAVKAAMQQAAKAMIGKHRAQVDAMARAGKNMLAEPETLARLERLVVSAAQRKRDAQVAEDLRILNQRDDVRAVTAAGPAPSAAPPHPEAAASKAPPPAASAAAPQALAASPAELRQCPMTLTYGGEIAATAAVGGEVAFGYASCSSNSALYAGFRDINLSAGVALGAEGAIEFGFWLEPPAQIAGPSIAVEVKGDAGVGMGIEVVFAAPSSKGDWLKVAKGDLSLLSFEGFVLFLATGEEFSASLVAGNTTLF